METLDYIKQYSQLYKEYAAGPAENMSELDSFIEQYTYIEKPSRDELKSQIELHMFWQIPPPLGLVRELEYLILQGVFFKSNPDVYYYVSEKYWPIIKHCMPAVLKCKQSEDDDFTHSMELYKKAPWHFDLTSRNCNSLECLKVSKVLAYEDRVINIECFEYLRSIGKASNLKITYAVRNRDFELVQYLHANGCMLCDIMDAGNIDFVEAFAYMCQYLKPNDYEMQSADYGRYIQLGEDIMWNLANVNATDCIIYLFNRKDLDIPMRQTKMWAARCGNLRLLTYLHEHDVPYVRYGCYKIDDDACRSYMRSTGCADRLLY